MNDILLITYILGAIVFMQALWLVWFVTIERKIENLRLRSHDHGRNE